MRDRRCVVEALDKCYPKTGVSEMTVINRSSIWQDWWFGCRHYCAPLQYFSSQFLSPVLRFRMPNSV